VLDDDHERRRKADGVEARKPERRAAFHSAIGLRYGFRQMIELRN
jgi:hypothetical protein